MNFIFISIFIFCMPNMLQAALPAQPASAQTKYVCPAAFLEDRDLLKENLKQNKEPFLEELFNVLAFQSHALISTMSDTEFLNVPVDYDIALAKENLTRYTIVFLYKQLHLDVIAFFRNYKSQFSKITLSEFVQAMTQIVGTCSVLDLKKMIKHEFINKAHKASPEITIAADKFFEHTRQSVEEYFLRLVSQNHIEDVARVVQNFATKNLQKGSQSERASTITESSSGYVPRCSWPQEQQQLLQDVFTTSGTPFFESLFSVLAHHIDYIIVQSSHSALSSDLGRDECRQKLMICLYEAVVHKIKPLFIDPQAKADVVRCMALTIQEMSREDFQSFVPVERMFDKDVQQDSKFLQFKEFEIRVERDFEQKRETLREPVQLKPSVVCKSSTSDDWDCPELWRECKKASRDYFKKNNQEFFPDLFNILACQIDALMAEVSASLFFAEEPYDPQQVKKYKFELSRKLLNDLYFGVYSDFMVNGKMPGYKNVVEDSLKNIPFEQLSKLIVFEKKCLPDNQVEVIFSYTLFFEQIQSNFKQNIELAKKAQSSIKDVCNVPPVAPQPFGNQKDFRGTCEAVKRKIIQLRFEFHDGLYQVIAKKLQNLIEIMPNEYFFSFDLKNNKLIVIKQHEVKAKRLDFYNKTMFMVYKSLWLDVMTRYKHDNKQLNNSLKGLGPNDYLAAQMLSIQNISEINLFNSLLTTIFQKEESELVAPFKEQSKNDFEKYLQEKFDTLQKIKKQQEEERLKQRRIAMQQLENLKLEETSRREIYEKQLNLEQQSFLTRENFENFVQQKKMEQIVDELVQEQANAAKDEQLKIEKLAAELLLEQRNELIIKRSSAAKLIQGCMRQKMSELYRNKQEQNIIAQIEKEIRNKKEANFQEMIKRNQGYATLAQNQKAENEENEKKLQARYEADFKKSSLDWELMMLGLEEKMEAFDTDFEKWQKAIVLVQKLLRQKQTDQHTANCAQSFQAWKSNVSKFLTKHKDDTNAVLAEFESEMQKNIDESFKKFTALSVLQRFGKAGLTRWSLAQDLKQKQLNEHNCVQQEQLDQQRLQESQLNVQAQPLNLRTNNPYDLEVVDPALFIELPDEQVDNPAIFTESPVASAPAQVASEYFYWTDSNGQSLCQDEKGFKYVWSEDLKSWRLLTQARVAPSYEPLPASTAALVNLQQARAHGWYFKTEQGLQEVLELNERAKKINQWREQNK